MRTLPATRIALLLLALGLLAARPAAAQTAEEAVLRTVQQLFEAMARRDTAGLNAVLTPEGQLVAVVVNGDSTRLRSTSHAEFIATIGTPGQALLERIWEPAVHISGPFAVVWAPYDFYLGRQFSHCGIDAFTLVRTPAGWRISGGSYSTVRTGCPASPLGPPK